MHMSRPSDDCQLSDTGNTHTVVRVTYIRVHTTVVAEYIYIYILGKVHSRTGHDGPEGELRYVYSSISLTSVIDGGG